MAPPSQIPLVSGTKFAPTLMATALKARSVLLTADGIKDALEMGAVPVLRSEELGGMSSFQTCHLSSIGPPNCNSPALKCLNFHAFLCSRLPPEQTIDLH